MNVNQERRDNTMSFTAILKNNITESKSFKNIEDLSAIATLLSEDVAPISIDFLTGVIKINHKIATRLEAYFAPNPKPIQYRKVSEEIGLIDYETHYEEAKKSAQDKVYLFENALTNPTQENYEKLNAYCSSLYESIPTKSYEEQTIGYEYSCAAQKTKIEITSSKELNSIVAHITITDLMTKQKHDSYMRLF